MCRSSSFQFLFFTSFQKLRSSPSPPVASVDLFTVCSRHTVQAGSRRVAQNSTHISGRVPMARFYQGRQIQQSAVSIQHSAFSRSESVWELRTAILELNA